MTARVVDLARIAAALRGLDAHVSAHPELASEAARERCDAWLEGEERLEAEEHALEERKTTRPASRSDRTP